jgi:hypothetical protein
VRRGAELRLSQYKDRWDKSLSGGDGFSVSHKLAGLLQILFFYIIKIKYS